MIRLRGHNEGGIKRVKGAEDYSLGNMKDGGGAATKKTGKKKRAEKKR